MRAVKWTLCLLVLSSCKENPQEYTGIISGQVLNYDGFHFIPTEYRRLTVATDPYSSFTPDYYGNFYFANVSQPYDLYLKYNEQYYHGLSIIFLSLKLTHSITIFPQGFYSRYQWVNVQISFPPIQKGKFGLLKFVSTEVFAEGVEALNESDSSIELQIKIGDDKPDIHGKIVFFQWLPLSKDSSQTQYDNFGLKDVTLNTWTNKPIIFSPADISFNPDEASVSVNVINNPSCPEHQTKVYIHFLNENPASDISITSSKNELNLLSTVPAKLPVPFNIKVSSTAQPYFYEEGPTLQTAIYLNPGQSTELDNSHVTELIYPLNGQKNVNDTTFLRYGDGTPGVYKVSLSSRIYYDIFTDRNSIQLKELKDKGLIQDYGSIRWLATKYTNFQSIDEFVSTPYIFQSNYISTKGSYTWEFSTNP